MEQTICEEVQKYIASGNELPAEYRRHLTDCRDCRDYAGFADAVMDAEKSSPAVPSALSEAVMRAAAEHLMAKRRMKIVLRTVFSAAAAVVICTALCFHFLPGPGSVKRSGISNRRISQVWSRDYDEKLFNFGCEVSSVSDTMPENLDSVTI